MLIAHLSTVTASLILAVTVSPIKMEIYGERDHTPLSIWNPHGKRLYFEAVDTGTTFRVGILYNELTANDRSTP